MSTRSTTLWCALYWAIGLTHGQVQVDQVIYLEGGTPAERQLHGLSESTLPQAVLTAGVEGAGTHRFATATEGPLWTVDLPSFTGPPVAGLHLLVRSDGASAGPLSMNLNGYGPFPITRGPTEALQADDVPLGTVLSLVFDGTSFQLMNGTAHRKRDCPSGMIQASSQFCIEQTERDSVEFFDAAMDCSQQGLRLCTWGEFIVACENAATLGVQQMVGNYEWTNNAANEDGGVRVAGNLNCRQAAVVAAVGNPRKFRCCLSR